MLEDTDMSDAPFPPAPLHPMRSQESGLRLSKKPRRALIRLVSLPSMIVETFDNSQRRRVTERLPQVTLHRILRREVDLFEEFR